MTQVLVESGIKMAAFFVGGFLYNLDLPWYFLLVSLIVYVGVFHMIWVPRLWRDTNEVIPFMVTTLLVMFTIVPTSVAFSEASFMTVMLVLAIWFVLFDVFWTWKRWKGRGIFSD